jgi:4-aminobutyrate aminotransferase-like enzyme
VLAQNSIIDGRRILDFISGYCVHNVGHNHPTVISALKDELDRNGPAMLQSHVSELAGELAARLCDRASGRLTRAFFCSSGSEGIETVIKFARAHTGRPGIVYAAGGFHGLTCGALSLMANPFWKEGFGPLLPDTESVLRKLCDHRQLKYPAKTSIEVLNVALAKAEVYDKLYQKGITCRYRKPRSG